MEKQLDLSLLEPVLLKYRKQDDALISILQEIQNLYSYLPEEALTIVSQKTGKPLSQIYAVATFYAQFYLNPRGRQTVKVCRGTACHVRGGSLILDAVERELGITDGETTPDFAHSLETVACIGACALAPAMVVGENTHGKITPGEAAKIIRSSAAKEHKVE
ncbi:NAD(P)H-dependent oxidoreductase subunit E [Chloroflexota bacterium]